MPPASATHSTIIRSGMFCVQVFVRKLNGMWVHAHYGYQVHPMIEKRTLEAAQNVSDRAIQGRQRKGRDTRTSGLGADCNHAGKMGA